MTMPYQRIFSDPTAVLPLGPAELVPSSAGGENVLFRGAPDAAVADTTRLTNGASSPPVSPSSQNILTPLSQQFNPTGGIVPIVPTGPFHGAPKASVTSSSSPHPGGATCHHRATTAQSSNFSASRRVSLNNPSLTVKDTDERVFFRNPLAGPRHDGEDSFSDSQTSDSSSVAGVEQGGVPAYKACVVSISAQQSSLSPLQVEVAEDCRGPRKPKAPPTFMPEVSGAMDDEDDDDPQRDTFDSSHSIATTEESDDGETDGAYCRVSSLLAVAVLMCLGAVVVGLLGFFPFYFIGVNASAKTTELLLSEAMRGVVTITQNSVSMLPAFVHITAFNYIKRQRTTGNETRLPSEASELMSSLASVVTRFEGSIQYLSFVVQNKLYATALYPVDASRFTFPAGSYNDTPSPSTIWRLNRTDSSIAQPPDAVGYTFFDKGQISPIVGMQGVVVPWAENGSTTRWLHDTITRTSTYFNYVLPFMIDDTYGFCEAGLPATNIIAETFKLTPSLRQHGRIVIMDTERDIVIDNSWGQNTSTVVNDPNYEGILRFLPLTIGQINDNVMKAAIQAVGSDGLRTLMKTKQTALVRFKYDGNNAQLNLTRLTDADGLSVVLGATVVRADFETTFVVARSVVISVTVGVVVLAAIIALLIAYLVVKPLKELGPELQRASALEISDDPTSDETRRCGKFLITEIHDIQAAYHKLKRSLREMKMYVPAAMMVTEDDGGGGGGDGARGGGKSGASGAGDPADGGGGLKRDVRLNTRIFHEQINSFKKKACTIVIIELRCSPDIDAVRATIDVISDTVDNYSGIIEHIGLNHMLISFGAHASLPLHSSKACNFTLHVYHRVPEAVRQFMVCLVDSSEFMVGNCGARNRNSRVVFGVGHLIEITKVLWDIGCHIAATPSTSSHLPAMQSVPVECVQLQGSGGQTVLCELRPPAPTGCETEVNADIELTKMAFFYMCSGEYELAIAGFNALKDKSNLQVQRLLRICQQRYAAGDKSIYVRATEDVYHFDYKADDPAATGEQSSSGSRVGGGVESVSSFGESSRAGPNAHSARSSSPSAGPAALPPPADALELVADSAVPSAADYFAGVAAIGTVREEVQSSGPDEMDGSCPLFDMMGGSASTSDDMPVAGGGAHDADTDLPLTLYDTGGYLWNRSVNKISDGAFSVVYLGMSDDGVQVAIKCIPRRRRDIKEKDIQAEIHMAASLRHANVVQYVACCITSTHLSIVMEYVPGGSLYAVIENFGSLNATVVRRFMIDVVTGLAYLHSGNIIHCDVKPHNILLGANGICKLSDFGSTISAATDLARSITNESVLRGSALYMASEVARGDRCTAQSDMYSLGISILEMLLGRPPWQWSKTAPAGSTQASLEVLYRNDARFVQLLSRGEVVPTIPESLNRDAFNFVKACCRTDPKKRATAQELLNYPFLI